MDPGILQLNGNRKSIPSYAVLVRQYHLLSLDANRSYSEVSASPFEDNVAWTGHVRARLIATCSRAKHWFLSEVPGIFLVHATMGHENKPSEARKALINHYPAVKTVGSL